MDDRSFGHESAGPLEVCWMSDVGLLRENNEDACLALPEEGMLILSDGMGGEPAGEVASERIIKWLPDLVRSHVPPSDKVRKREVESALRDVLVALNHQMRQESSSLDGASRMGATVTMALIRGSVAHIAHMGDSRAYIIRGPRMHRLTKDHSVVGTLVERGIITPEQAENHPMRGQLSRYIGMGGEARGEVTAVRLKKGDRLLLCSDGLTGSLTDEEIMQAISVDGDLRQGCRRLVEAANAAGGRDNVSVVLASWNG